MKGKTKLSRLWKVILGIATEITMVASIVALGLGLAWLISGGWR